MAGTATQPHWFFTIRFTARRCRLARDFKQPGGCPAITQLQHFLIGTALQAGRRNAIAEMYTLVRVIVIFPSLKYVTIHRGRASERQALH